MTTYDEFKEAADLLRERLNAIEQVWEDLDAERKELVVGVVDTCYYDLEA